MEKFMNSLELFWWSENVRMTFYCGGFLSDVSGAFKETARKKSINKLRIRLLFVFRKQASKNEIRYNDEHNDTNCQPEMNGRSWKRNSIFWPANWKQTLLLLWKLGGRSFALSWKHNSEVASDSSLEPSQTHISNFSLDFERKGNVAEVEETASRAKPLSKN